MKKLFLLSLAFATVNVSAQNAWTPQAANITDSTACVAEIAAVSSQVAWLIGFVPAPANFGGQPFSKFSRTINGGNSWVAGTLPIPLNYTPSSIAAANAMTAWITCYNLINLNNGRIYKTTDGGSTWTHQSSAVFAEPARFIHFFDPNTGVAIGDSAIYRTVNGGTLWTPVNGGLQRPTNRLPYSGTTAFMFNAYEIKGDHIWLGDAYGNFYHSRNRGTTWSCLSTTLYPFQIKGLAFRDTLSGLAIGAVFSSGNSGGSYSDNGIIYKTSDGGNTWVPTMFLPSALSWVNYTMKYDISYIPGTNNTYVLTEESNIGYSVITSDGGQNWVMLDSNVKHTACVFLDTSSGWSGGYFHNQNVGIFKWVGTMPPAATADVQTLETKLVSFPSPVENTITLRLVGVAGEAKTGLLTIIDQLGRICSQEKIQLEPERPLSLSVHSLMPGNYLIQFHTGEAFYTTRFIKR